MNIAEILKYCPEGTKLYSTTHGEVVLKTVHIDDMYPIVTVVYNESIVRFTEEGHYTKSCPGECVLFPSEDQRDWSTFRIPVKKGDIMMQIDGTLPFIASGESTIDDYPKYICGSTHCGNFKISNNNYGWTYEFYIPASEEAKKELFDKMAEAGYRWNADTLELEKIEPKFKEGDIKKSQNTSISMNFGKAIEALKAGSAIRRSGWNGKGLFVVKQIPTHITVDSIPNIPNMQSLPQSAKNILMNRENPHIDYTNQMLIINPDGRADSWVPSSSDVFAEDWEVVDE